MNFTFNKIVPVPNKDSMIGLTAIEDRMAIIYTLRIDDEGVAQTTMPISIEAANELYKLLKEWRELQ
jgi:hypothetical protein